MQPKIVCEKPRAPDLEEAIDAFNRFGANCGPGALAAVTGITIENLASTNLEMTPKTC